MPKYDLSILIPARNEMFLARTIQDILEHKKGNTEILVGLDGQWADPEIPDHPDVRILYVAESIGQRAITNRLCKMSEAKYIIKCDAHCAFDDGFDVKLMDSMQDDWTMVPTMRNLHAFDWVCPDGHRRYQGPSGPCQECNQPTERDVVWIPKTSPQSKSYTFDTTMHFQYFGEFNKRPEGQGDITLTMSLQGSFFMLTREKYWELNICDEEVGSWGQQGVEVAMKTWLSGGKVMVNQKTWYAHMFRTQGADFGFPYPISGRQVDHARKHSRDLWLNNKFNKQIYPLSWVLDKFAPLPHWDEDSLARVREAGTAFLATHPLADTTDSLGSPCSIDYATIREGMSTATSISPGPEHVLSVGNSNKVEWIAAPPVVAKVVKFQPIGNLTDQPLIGESMGSNTLAIYPTTTLSGINEEPPIPGVVKSASPVPAGGGVVNGNIGNQSSDSVDIHGNIVPQNTEKGIIYYTDNQLPIKMAKRVQSTIKASGLPIVSASLKPMDKMGKNIHLPLKRGKLTMFKQQLAALETLDTEYVFFCEHDVLYPKEHFDFTPPTRDRFYYNHNWWKIGNGDLAVHWDADQVSGLCCDRKLAVEWYRKMVESFDETTFNRKYEPESGTNSESWKSSVPLIDIRHSHNLTYNKWQIDDFRNKDTAVNFEQTTIDKIPGWENLQELI